MRGLAMVALLVGSSGAAQAGEVCTSFRSQFQKTDWCGLAPVFLPDGSRELYVEPCQAAWARASCGPGKVRAWAVCADMVKEMVSRACWDWRIPDDTEESHPRPRRMPNGELQVTSWEMCYRTWLDTYPVAVIDICGLPPPKR